MNLLVDIGGTNTRVSAATNIGAILPPKTFTTEKDMDAAVARIAHAAKDILKHRTLTRIVSGVTGQVEQDGMLLASPNLPLWRGKNLKEALQAEFGVPAHVLNDAVLGGLGEAHKGAGKGAKVLLYMTFGTGIGAARIIHGVPDVSVGSETGHQYLVIDETLVEAEDVVSGKALRKRYGVGGEELHDPALWKECARYAAVVIHNTALHFMPDLIVVGGSLVKDGSLHVEDIELRYAEIAHHSPRLPRIVRGTLGDQCGLYGAQAYASMDTKERNRVLKNERRRVDSP